MGIPDGLTSHMLIMIMTGPASPLPSVTTTAMMIRCTRVIRCTSGDLFRLEEEDEE